MAGTSGSLLAYSVAGAARALGISRRQVYRLLRDGALRAVKSGNRTLIPRRELVRYLRTCPAYEPPDAA